MCALPAALAWILSRRWSSGPRRRYAGGFLSGGRPGWALVVTGHAVGGNAARLKRAQKGGAGGDPEETALGGGCRGRLLGRPRLPEDVVSIKLRGRVQVRLLLTGCSCALSGMSLRLPDPSGGAARRRPSPGRWPRPGARSTICSRRAGRPGAVEEARARREAGTRRTRPSPGGGQGCTWTGRRRAGRSSGHRA